MPKASPPIASVVRTTARIAAFIPGASPPLVRTAMRLSCFLELTGLNLGIMNMGVSPRCARSFDLVRQPEIRPRREPDLVDLGSGRERGAFELLVEKALEEDVDRAVDVGAELAVVRESDLGERVDLLAGKPVIQEMIEVEVV